MLLLPRQLLEGNCWGRLSSPGWLPDQPGCPGQRDQDGDLGHEACKNHQRQRQAFAQDLGDGIAERRQKAETEHEDHAEKGAVSDHLLVLRKKCAKGKRQGCNPVVVRLHARMRDPAVPPVPEVSRVTG